MARKPGPWCPDCGAEAPLRLMLWGLGKPFPCEGCGRSLMVPKSTGFGLVMGALLLFWRLRDAEDFTRWNLILAIGLMALVGILGWLTMRVRRAD